MYCNDGGRTIPQDRLSSSDREGKRDSLLFLLCTILTGPAVALSLVGVATTAYYDYL